MRASFPALRGLWPARTLRGIGRDGKPTNSGAFAEISPLLIYIAVVLSAAALLAMATNFRPSHLHSTIGRAGMSGTSELQDMQRARSDKLPVEDFEDRSLVFPRETKH